MKKKLLFVLPSLVSGGAEKSLVSLLQTIDSSRYDVDLFLFRREGLFLPLVPPFVRVTDAGELYAVFDGNAKNAVLFFLKRGKFVTALRRVLYGRSQRLPTEQSAQIGWKYLSGMLPRLSGYDAAVGYLEGTSTYFVLDNVEAKQKLSFLHTDYDRIAAQKDMDARYYARLDMLVGVSDVCTQKAEAYFPFLRGRTRTMHNIISAELIRKMADEPCDLPTDVPAVLTVARLSPPKGIDLAVQACAVLQKRGVPFRWYHIGAGELRAEIEEQIRSEGVEDTFILLGERSNPYAYMRACTVYVQPSRFEGKSIAVDEAKALCKPIVVTDFGTVRDQITDGVNGHIVPQTAEGLADAIEALLTDGALRQTFCENLRNEHVGNTEEIEILYSVLETEKNEG